MSDLAAEGSRIVITEELRARIDAADGRPDELRAVFAWLESAVGMNRASGMWWAVFAETDAAAT